MIIWYIWTELCRFLRAGRYYGLAATAIVGGLLYLAFLASERKTPAVAELWLMVAVLNVMASVGAGIGVTYLLYRYERR